MRGGTQGQPHLRCRHGATKPGAGPAPPPSPNHIPLSGVWFSTLRAAYVLKHLARIPTLVKMSSRFAHHQELTPKGGNVGVCNTPRDRQLTAKQLWWRPSEKNAQQASPHQQPPNSCSRCRPKPKKEVSLKPDKLSQSTEVVGLLSGPRGHQLRLSKNSESCLTSSWNLQIHHVDLLGDTRRLYRTRKNKKMFVGLSLQLSPA